jgi:hypothetical protein
MINKFYFMSSREENMYKAIIMIILLTLTISIWADVKTCVPVVKVLENQINQVVVSDGLGGAFVAWQDGRSGGVNIYAQRVDTDGNMLWADNGVLVCGAANDQGQLSMISDGNNNAIIVWQDNRNSNLDLYAQKVNSLGAMQWTSNGVAVCTNATIQSIPKMSTDGTNGAFITWSDDRNGDNDIFVTHINAAGFVSPANGTRIGDNTAGISQRNPEIVNDGALGAIIAYEQMSPTNGWDIFAQRIDASCTIQWIGGGVPACIAAYDQLNPKLANDAIGSAVIVWEDFVNSANFDIYAQRVASVPPTGAIQWAAGGVLVKGGAYDQLKPVIATVAPNTTVIVWQDFSNGTNFDIYAKKISGTTTPTFDWGGAPYYAVGVPVCTLQGGTNQINPQIVIDNNDGGVIIVWQDDRNLIASGEDIYANHLDSAGSFKGEGVTNGYGICTFTGDQTMPKLANNSPNDVVFAWMDTRDWLTLGYDIYTLGVEAPGHTYFIESHDVLTPAGTDLGAEILFNGASFPTPIHTSYTFGLDGNEPLLAGIYTVIHPDYAGWVPVSVTITDIDQDYTTNFLGIRYILNVTSTPTSQGILKDTVDLGVLTNSTFYNSNVAALTGDYTLEAAPDGFIWVPSDIDVIAGDFNVGNNYTYTINFELTPETLPVEFTSFRAIATSEYFVNLFWTTQTETNLSGYYVYRNTESDIGSSIRVSGIISATNTSQSTNYNYTDREVEAGNTYYYWLQALDLNGVVNFHGPISVLLDDSTITPVVPGKTCILPVYPNPFNPTTNIPYQIKTPETVTISIYNNKGQLVRSFSRNHAAAGVFNVSFDGRNSNGKPLACGVYTCIMKAGQYNSTTKMVLLR